MNTPIALDFTQAHAITAQAGATENTLENQGQQVYNRDMALSQAATVAGNQLITQSNASNQMANKETANAQDEAKIMSTTGASGNLYQTALTAQDKIFNYSPAKLAQTQELQNQTIGEGKTALNQLENVQGGTRGLSAAGVQAKAQELTTQTNNMETQLGLSIQAQQQAATTAETQASTESGAEFNSEQEAQTSYVDAATQYANEAKTYANAAQTEYDNSSNYASLAVSSRDSFMIAAYDVANAALDASQSLVEKAYTQLAQQETGYINSNAAFTRSEATTQQQTNTFNQQEDQYHIAAAKQAFAN